MQPHLIKTTEFELAICLTICKHLNLSLKWCQCDSYVLQNSSYASCKYFDDEKLFQVSQSLNAQNIQFKSILGLLIRTLDVARLNTTYDQTSFVEK
jgi:hypothetical protein